MDGWSARKTSPRLFCPFADLEPTPVQKIRRPLIRFERFCGAVQGDDDVDHQRTREYSSLVSKTFVHGSSSSSSSSVIQHSLLQQPRYHMHEHNADSFPRPPQSLIDEQKTYLPLPGPSDSIHTVYDIHNITYRYIVPAISTHISTQFSSTLHIPERRFRKQLACPCLASPLTFHHY